jgi:hypothetical protein
MPASLGRDFRLGPTSEMRSVNARNRLDPTKTRWIATDHMRSRSDMFFRFMKAFSTWTAEIATIEDISLSSGR